MVMRSISTATPHTRGSTPTHIPCVIFCRGYPAHAGIDLSVKEYLRITGGLPRTRGDRPCKHLVACVYAGATPHTRGSTLLCKCILKSCTGYPAHAGIDRILYLVQTKLFGLPRTRGDRPY